MFVNICEGQQTRLSFRPWIDVKFTFNQRSFLSTICSTYSLSFTHIQFSSIEKVGNIISLVDSEHYQTIPRVIQTMGVELNYVNCPFNLRIKHFTRYDTICDSVGDLLCIASSVFESGHVVPRTVKFFSMRFGFRLINWKLLHDAYLAPWTRICSCIVSLTNFYVVLNEMSGNFSEIIWENLN